MFCYTSFLASTHARPSIAIKDTIVFDQYFGLGPSSGSIEYPHSKLMINLVLSISTLLRSPRVNTTHTYASLSSLWPYLALNMLYFDLVKGELSPKVKCGYYDRATPEEFLGVSLAYGAVYMEDFIPGWLNPGRNSAAFTWHDSSRDEWNKVAVKTFSAQPGPSALLEYGKIRPGFEASFTIKPGLYAYLQCVWRLALCFDRRKK